MAFIDLNKVVRIYNDLKSLNDDELSELMSMWGDIEFNGGSK